MTQSIRNAVIFLACLAIPPALAHDCWGDHHCENGSRCDQHRGGNAVQSYGRTAPSAAAVARVMEGKISEIIYLPAANPDSAMVEVRMSAGAAAVLVRLAPVGLLKQGQLLLREGDAVSVTGFDVNGMEGDVLVATEIRKGEKRLVLRDMRGQPSW